MPSPGDPFLFQLGPFAIRWYGLLIVGGAVAAAYVGSIEARRKREDPDHAWNLLIWCLLLGILGARVYHVLSSPAGNSRGFEYYFIEQPFATLNLFGAAIPFPTALMIWEGGIGIFGGVVGGILAVFIYTRRYQLNAWRWLDNLAPGMLLAQAIGRWGNFINQELYGPPTDLPWGILIEPQYRLAQYANLTAFPPDTRFHPTFLYESIMLLVGFLLLAWLNSRYRDRWVRGTLFGVFLIWWGGNRAWIELFRPDQTTVGDTFITYSMILSLGIALAGVLVILSRYEKLPKRSKRKRPLKPKPKRG
jgi:phosphatidylglycerol---prolipoprotein diacylglyceryl transferase